LQLKMLYSFYADFGAHSDWHFQSHFTIATVHHPAQYAVDDVVIALTLTHLRTPSHRHSHFS
jgi:hypothetical protein